ncbi:unnamed protein product, partial [Brassica oleracea]
LGSIVLLGLTACSPSRLTFRLLRCKHSKTDQSIIFNPPLPLIYHPRSGFNAILLMCKA